MNINRKWVSTFFTTLTAKQFCHQRFFESESDEAKVDIFTNHPSFYADIRGEVKDWVQENWLKWKEERPAWFTKSVRVRIPFDMTPQ